MNNVIWDNQKTDSLVYATFGIKCFPAFDGVADVKNYGLGQAI